MFDGRRRSSCQFQRKDGGGRVGAAAFHVKLFLKRCAPFHVKPPELPEVSGQLQ